MVDKLINIIAKGKDEASNILNGVTKSAGGIGTALAGVATGGAALALAAVVAIGAAAVATAVSVLKFATDSDNAMKKFSAQTGITGDELEAMEKSARSLWATGFGDNIADVIDSMKQVKLATGESGDALEQATANAMTLANVFEYDVAESTATISSMMKSFGITSEQAFDIITTGAQMGLDVQNDLLDTMREYSGDFENLGFTADQALSILNAGLEEGAYNTDVVADGFREMGIRLMEGGEDISGAFDTMGMDFERIQGFIAAGDESWGEYVPNIIEGLMAIDDEVVRNATGIEIFGTKWEDLGGDIFMAAGLATQGIDGIEGATEAAQATMDTGFGPALERLKRGFIENLSPLGDIAAEQLDKLAPILDEAALWLQEKIPVAIEWLSTKWNEFWPVAKAALLDFWNTISPHLITLWSKLTVLKTTVLPQLKTIWDDVFNTASATLTSFWEAIKPGIEWVAANLKTYYEQVLPALSEGWETLKAATQPIVDLWNNALKPAFEQFLDVLGLTKDATDEAEESTGLFGEGIGKLVATFISTAVEVIIDGVTAGVQLLTIAFYAGKQAVVAIKGVIAGLAPTFDRISSAISKVIGWIGDLIAKFSGLHLPDWLTPGSPTPLEIGLKGISKELSRMPSFTELFGAPGSMGMPSFSTSGPPVPIPSPISVAGGRGRGGSYVIHNTFGQDSVRSEEDIMNLADQITNTLELRGLAPAW